MPSTAMALSGRAQRIRDWSPDESVVGATDLQVQDRTHAIVFVAISRELVLGEMFSSQCCGGPWCRTCREPNECSHCDEVFAPRIASKVATFVVGWYASLEGKGEEGIFPRNKNGESGLERRPLCERRDSLGWQRFSEFVLPHSSRNKILDSIFLFWRKLTAGGHKAIGAGRFSYPQPSAILSSCQKTSSMKLKKRAP